MKSVLVVDDDEGYRELLEMALREECGVGHVLGFESGASLLRHLGANGKDAPTLVLLDLHMPDTTGVKLVQEIRRLAPQVPIAFLSGAARAEERDVCIEAGAFAFVTKPVKYSELVRLLRDLLQSTQDAQARGTPDPARAGRQL